MSPPQDNPSPAFRAARFPWVTVAAMAAWILLSLALASRFGRAMDPRRANEALADFWILDAHSIWGGAYWGLLGMSFVHASMLLLGGNLLLCWLLGSRLEALLGHQFIFAIVFFASLVSAGAQLALGHGVALGSSGVCFALLGLALALRPRHPFLRLTIPRWTLAFAFWWLAACFAMLYGMGISVPLAGNMAGLIFGHGIGLAMGRGVQRRLGVTLVALALTLALLGVLWAPWRTDWLVWRALRERGAGNVELAAAQEARVLRRGGPNELNRLAWTLATSRADAARDGRAAIPLAWRACVLAKWAEPTYIDTLAAAYAEAGQRDRALRTQRNAVEAERRLEALDLGRPPGQLELLVENLATMERGDLIRD